MKKKRAAISIACVILLCGCKQNLVDGDLVSNTHSVSVDTSAAGGTVAICPLKERYNDKEKIVITATPVDGYGFSGWSGSVSGNENPMSLAVDADKKIIPVFSKKSIPEKYTVQSGTVTGGTVSFSPRKDSYDYGDTVTVTATPNAGYMFSKWQNGFDGKAQSFNFVVTANITLNAVFMKRAWTILAYMAADNDLESSAIQDLNEMESVALSGVPVTTLILLDRASGYDQTNGDWTDTRMFELSTDPDGLNNTITSNRIACPKLGITTTETIELNMADPVTLQYFVQFAKTAYPADEYCLLIWGHGTGWRSSSASSGNAVSPEKAFAIDDTSNAYMSLSQMRSALNNQGISVLAFDTCFGALLEIGYEFRTSANFLIGSEGSTPSTGWDYAAFLGSFYTTDFSDSSLISSAFSQFSRQYSGTPGASISAMNLSKIGTFRVNFDAFSSAVAATITDSSSQKIIRDIMLKNCDLFHSTSYPCDVYIDIDSLRQQIAENISAPAVQTAALTLSQSLSGIVINSWSQDGSKKLRIGVSLIPFEAAGTPRLSHDSAYIQGSGVTGQSCFVVDSTGWVPTANGSVGTLLDKIFYFPF